MLDILLDWYRLITVFRISIVFREFYFVSLEFSEGEISHILYSLEIINLEFSEVINSANFASCSNSLL